MSVDFSNASLLSLSLDNSRFSEESLMFKRKRSISIKGFLTDLANSNGVEKNIKDSESFLESLIENNQEIILKGEVLGEGFVKSFSISGEFIRDAEYSADLEIFEAVNLSELKFSGNGNDLDFNSQSQVTKEDLRLLNSFSEKINISGSESSEVSISHEINCSFLKSKSLISRNLSVWNNGTIQNNKLVNLNNKGKNSLKVQGGAGSPDFSFLTLNNLNVGSEYVLEFEFLGINEVNSTEETKAEVVWSGGLKSKEFSVPGFKKIFFTPSNSSVDIRLYSPSSKNSFYKSITLYKKRNTPIERSRSISNLFLSSNPIFGFSKKGYGGIFQHLSSWNEDVVQESFDEVSSSYSVNKEVSFFKIDGIYSDSFITPTPNEKKYSLNRNTNLNFDANGVVSVDENSSIKMLENSSSLEFNEVIENIINGSKQRCLDKLSSYSNRFEYGCSGQTPISTNTFLKFVNKSINKNLFENSCEVSISFSNDLSIESPDYTHEESAEINYIGKNYSIAYSGTVSGTEGTPSQRYENAKTAFNASISNNISQKINKIKNRIISKIDSNANQAFFEKQRGLSLDKAEGIVSYTYVYTNEESGEESENGVLKSFEISVNESKRTPRFNNFKFGCTSVAQMLGFSDNPKQKTVSIKSIGYEGQSPNSIYKKSIEKLNQKGLFLGEDSKLSSPPANQEVFIVGENFSFSREENSISYTRDVLDLSECMNSSPRPTPTPDFGLWLSGLDPNELHYPTPTKNPDFDDFIPLTPYVMTPTPFRRSVYPTPTPE